MSREILVLAEHRQGKLRDISLEMLSQASRLAGKMGSETVAVLLGSGLDNLAATLVGYSDKVLYVDDSCFMDYNSEQYLRFLFDLIKQRGPEIVMVGQSSQGVDLAPALAVEANLPLITDVIDIKYQEEKLQVTRQFFQGKVNADYTFRGEYPYLVTIREGCFEIAEPHKCGKIEKLNPLQNQDISYRRFLEYIEAEIGEVDITKSSVLIAAGRGIKEEKNLKIIEELAQALNADVCGSRVTVDAGWLGQDRQVGITGKTVKPKLYIAIGISGSSQHLAGMKGAKTIVAINKDPNAPIFSVADYAIVDDLFKVVPKLTEKIKELRQ